MVTASLEPRLIGSRILEFIIRFMPFRQSSIYMKLRVCSPEPQISISCLPVSLASITFRQIAAGAFSRPPSQVPHGPHVVESRHARIKSEIFPEVTAHSLGEELLPAIAVFRHRRVSILFS